MMRIIWFIESVRKRILSHYNKIINHYTLKHNKVVYETLPTISGVLKIRNQGKFEIKRNVKFNSSIESNFVGLFKPCTIAVMPTATLIIKDNCGFSGISIFCSEHITIHENVNCGGNVSIWDTDFHPLEYLSRRNNELETIKKEPIIIEQDVFIGANSIILKGVTIGARSIIGAGSIVTKNVPADEIWGGNPAKFIRKTE
ncbi:2,3,4,5-tetrahydropyridine-2,6-dicarboxylate N-acetyltransferase [compost metagenome]